MLLESPARVLAPESVLSSALVLAAATLASAAVDAAVAAAVADRAIVDALFRPTPREIASRVALAVLLFLLHRSRATSRRLHLLSSALATAPDGIQITTLDGVVTYSNGAVQDIYGFSPEELLGKHVDEMNADPTFASRAILPALAKDGRWAGELEVKHKGGHTFPIWLTTSLVLDRRGRPFAAIGVIRDMSERRRSEQELRDYARRLEDATGLKDLFSDILRHDLLGPAATVQLTLDALLRRGADPATSRRMLEGARRSCAKLIDMIEGASKFARLSAPQRLELGTVELGAMLEGIVADAERSREERNARIVFERRGEFRVRAHPMIADVFENLLSNALKYGRSNGTVHVSVVDEGERWRVCVADRGEGIPDADKQKLFTRFERLRKEGVKGTGLGLAIAKRIVDLHRGSIWVENNPGGGSVFCVALPKETAADPG